MATQQSASKTLSRCVLGDLTPRAINTPSSLPSDIARAQSPLKQVTTHTPTAIVEKENITTSSVEFKGKKRSIEEVDSAETPEHLKMLACARDESLFNSGMRLTTDAMQKHTVASTLSAKRLPITNTSKENNPIGLADPGSPTERATLSPSPGPELQPESQPEPVQASQKSTISFSDLLDYDMCASQKSQTDVLQEPVPILPPKRVVVEEKKKSRAEQLRARLEFGMYKVKTGQACRRDAEIIGAYEAGKAISYSLDALNASRPTAMTSSGGSLGSYRVPNITISSPRRDQPTFVKANLDPFRPIGKLGAAPVQFAIPTGNMAPSSRMIHGYDYSSSPPGVGLLKSVAPGQLKSPARQKPNYPMPIQSRDRIGEHDMENMDTALARQRLQWLNQQKYFEGGVKANAADSLLQLMQSG